MGRMHNMADAEAEVRASIDSINAHFAKYKPLLEAVFPILGAWSREPYNYGSERDERGRAVGVAYAPTALSISCVAIDLYLGPDDSITKDVVLFAETHVDPIAELFGLEDSKPASYVELGWSGLEYRGNGLRIMVRGWFAGSNKCKVIGTGEMEEKKKVVCDD